MEETSSTDACGTADSGARGEAGTETDAVCEGRGGATLPIPVDKLCQKGGDKAVFKMLDDKYGPQPTDMLHKALKDIFLRPHHQASRELSTVHGAIRNREPTACGAGGDVAQESLRLHAAEEDAAGSHDPHSFQGDLQLDTVTSAIKAVFPGGMGDQLQAEGCLRGRGRGGRLARSA